MFQPIPELRSLNKTALGVVAVIAVFIGTLIASLTLEAFIFAGAMTLAWLLWSLRQRSIVNHPATAVDPNEDNREP